LRRVPPDCAPEIVVVPSIVLDLRRSWASKTEVELARQILPQSANYQEGNEAVDTFGLHDGLTLTRPT